MWNLDTQPRKKINWCMVLQANKNILRKNPIRMQNISQQFKYQQLDISPNTTKIKLLRF